MNQRTQIRYELVNGKDTQYLEDLFQLENPVSLKDQIKTQQQIQA